MNKRPIIELFKRFFLIAIFLIPIYVVLDNALGENASNVTKIAIFVLLGGLLVGTIELIRYLKLKK
jgi:hypothetical protein